MSASPARTGSGLADSNNRVSTAQAMILSALNFPFILHEKLGMFVSTLGIFVIRSHVCQRSLLIELMVISLNLRSGRAIFPVRTLDRLRSTFRLLLIFH
jgi:hypothetical protein